MMTPQEQAAAEDYYQHGAQIVLHEEKQYYADAEQVYGPDVRALVMEEDAQPLTTPIVEPPRTHTFQEYDKETPTTKYELDYFAALSQKPELIRNIAVCGALHAGKTLLCDAFYLEAHEPPTNFDPAKEYKFTDCRKDERAREISLKTSTLSLLLPDSRGKSYLFNIADTPGHPGFTDEVTVGMRLADAVIVMVDVVEGVTQSTHRVIREAMA